MKAAARPVSWPRALGAIALLLPGVVAFQPTFGGLQGYLAALVGVLIGAALAVVWHRFRWRLGYRILSLAGAYLLVGGTIAVPDTTILGFLPSLETLSRLSVLVFQGWRDLLTVATPAGDFSGPAAVPFLAALIVAAALVSWVLASAAIYLPLLVPVAWLGLAIAFGIRQTSTATWLGAALGVGLLAWLVSHQQANRRAASSAILLRKESGLTRRTVALLSAVAVSLGAAGVAVGANAMAAQVNRQVLRDDVVPPLNLQEYTSPLMSYRRYEVAQKDDVLFKVSGMPEGSRLRLAVLETYDGNVFNVSQNANQYLRSGRELPVDPEETVDVGIEVVDYSGVWIPTVGESSRIEFTGQDAGREAKGLYFNKTSQQALTTAGLTTGSTIALEAAPTLILTDAEREAISSAGLGKASLATVERVPDVLVRASSDWTAEATSAYQQLAIMAEKLRTEGYYSDGSDGLSRSGHTAERLGSMFNANQWIGDDEQYATALALMATQLGIPARVVLGFHPLDGDAPSDVWEVTGTEAHVWVEANLDGAGWVSFDATPDRDQTPQTDVPKPKPKPKPQVDPPPDPPEKLPDDVIVPDEDAANVDEKDENNLDWLGPLLMWVGIGLGSAAVVSLPFLTIVALKRRRSNRRATLGSTSDQLAGAWDDVVDRARDLGQGAASSDTRYEAASALQKSYPESAILPLAGQIDSAVFGAGEPAARQRDLAWEQADGIKKELLATVPWYRRPGAIFSLRSLRRSRPAGAQKPPRERRRGRGAATALPQADDPSNPTRSQQ